VLKLKFFSEEEEGREFVEKKNVSTGKMIDAL